MWGESRDTPECLKNKYNDYKTGKWSRKCYLACRSLIISKILLKSYLIMYIPKMAVFGSYKEPVLLVLKTHFKKCNRSKSACKILTEFFVLVLMIYYCRRVKCDSFLAASVFDLSPSTMQLHLLCRKANFR